MLFDLVEHTVLDEVVVTLGLRPQSEPRSLLSTLIIYEERVSAVGTSRVNSLKVILFNEGGPHQDVDDARANQVYSCEFLALTQNSFVFGELDVLHAVVNFLQKF